MTEPRLVRIIVWREIYSRRKAFMITTVLLLGLVVGGLAIAGLASSTEETPVISVGAVDVDTAILQQEIMQNLDPETVLNIDVYEIDAGMAALREDEIDALVVNSHEVVWAQGMPHWMMSPITTGMFTMNLDYTAGELGLSDEDLTLLLAPINGQTIDYEEQEENEAEAALAVITVILMFVGILAYGQWIAYGVVEEKANRVAELILGAVTPGQLLLSKMIALGGLGLTQLVLVVVTGLVAGNLFLEFELPPVATTAAAWLIFWFIVGYVFYGSLYAASGSLAADSQEAGSFIGPLNILPGLGYMLGVIAFPSGSDTLARILSLIPFWSPLLMPGRIMTGSVEPWELALSIVLTVGATVVAVRVASKVYLGGITQASQRVSWRQAFKGGEDLTAA